MSIVARMLTQLRFMYTIPLCRGIRTVIIIPKRLRRKHVGRDCRSWTSSVDRSNVTNRLPVGSPPSAIYIQSAHVTHRLLLYLYNYTMRAYHKMVLGNRSTSLKILNEQKHHIYVIIIAVHCEGYKENVESIQEYNSQV